MTVLSKCQTLKESFLCSAMDSQVTIEGSAAVFSCQAGCAFDISAVTWYHNQRRLEPKVSFVSLVDQGSLLILHQVTKNMSGIYTCEVSVDRSIYKRTGVLEVLDISGGEILEDNCGKYCKYLFDLKSQILQILS